MKKLFIALTMVSFIFCFTGCNEDSSTLSTEDIITLNKAGTDFAEPNTFDAEGNYYILSDESPVYLTDSKTPMEIWMGVGNEKAGTLVGRVSFEANKVIIDLTDADNDGTPDMYPYVLNLAHIHFADNKEGIPQTKSGNPIPGQFEYNVPMDPRTVRTEILIPTGIQEFGAIHLEVVKYGGVEGFNFYLPNNEVTMKIIPDTDGDSYVDLQIMGGGFISDYNGGLYEGWCLAADLLIYYNTTYDAYLYSSYEEISQVILDQANINSENLDNANYLMNHYNVGDEVFENGISLGVLTKDDIQHALWNLINGKNYTDVRVVLMVDDALAYGDGFVPNCDQKIIFLAVPLDGEMVPDAQLIIGQPIIAEIPVPCEDEGGTAWGDGYWGATFPGQQWGTWFQTTTTD